jgi:hypothetical protein
MAKGTHVAGIVTTKKLTFESRSSWQAVYVRASIRADVKTVAPVKKKLSPYLKVSTRGNRSVDDQSRFKTHDRDVGRHNHPTEVDESYEFSQWTFPPCSHREQALGLIANDGPVEVQG